MFDFDEIEEDVSRKGAVAWTECGKDSSKLQEEATRKAEEVARRAAAAKIDGLAGQPGAPGAAQGALAAPVPVAAVRAGPAVAGEVDQPIGSLQTVLWRPEPSEGGQRKPAIVICAGNPARALGSSHMGAPLVLALFDAVASAGFPVLRFDYRGVGRSALERTEQRDPAPSESAEDAIAVARWALEHLGGPIVIAGYSYGTSMSLAVLSAGLAASFVALSCGTEQWRMFEGDPEESARRKEDQVRHSRLTVPAIYICGENDWITSQSELRRIIAAREDGGAAVQVEVIPNVKHELLGQEVTAARMAAEWLQVWWGCEQS
mmetsp:Transcript_80348/g.239326  ORF Transcript_80348/g.239326 Transcript_80348/m.239326 type:complete len:319 (-) Transcript_80348:37-993(-)